MKYKILTVLLIITLTLGSFQLNTKGAEPNDKIIIDDIITQIPINQVWTYTGSGYYTFGYDSDYEYIYSYVSSIILDSQYNGRYTKIRLSDGVLNPTYFIIIDLEIYDITISIDVNDTYEIELANKNIANTEIIKTSVLYISVFDNNYVEQEYQDAFDAGVSKGLNDGQKQGFDSGILFSYQLGFNDAYNPITNEYYTNEGSYSYGVGYEDGVSTTYENGFNGIRNPFTDQFYKDEDSYSYGLGWDDGYEDGLDFDAFGWLKSIIYFIGWILNVQFIPGVSLGRIAMLVLFIYLIPFIFKMFGGSD